MTDNSTLADNNIKDFDGQSRYVLCDICTFDGYPYEKVLFRYIGFRSEDEDGFAYKYTVNDFHNPDKIHIHRSSNQIFGTSYLCSQYQQKTTSPDRLIADSQLEEHFDNKSCSDRIFTDCRTDHSFSGSFEDAITIIDLLPQLFPSFFKNSSSGGINKLQELVN
jgi:hypothetical protein